MLSTLAFVSSELRGSLVGQAQATDSIETVDELDSFDFSIAGNQTITIAVRPDEGLRPDVDLVDAAGNTVARGRVSRAGEGVLMQSVPITSPGQYAVEIGSASRTTGHYELQVLLNAALEDEAFFFGRPNNSSRTAQDLDAGWTRIGNSNAERSAVVGVREPDLIENFELGVLDEDEWTVTSSDPSGIVQVTSELDAADGTHALLMAQSGSDGTLVRNEATWRVDLSPYVLALLQFSHTEFRDEEHLLPETFTGSADGDGVAISEDGVTWHRVFQAPDVEFGEWQSESIDLVAVARDLGIRLDDEFFIRFQQTDDTPFPSDGRAYDAIQIITTPSSRIRDWYEFELSDRQSTTIALKAFGPSFPDARVNLYNEELTLLASGTAARDIEYLVVNYQDHTTDGRPDQYFVEVFSPGYDFELFLTRNADFDREDNATLPTSQSIAPSEQLLGYVSGELTGSLEPIQSFAGLDFTNLTPPDPTLAVGPEHLVTLVNSDIAIHDKGSGTQVFRQSISGESGFFGTTGATATVFDPWVIYDADSERFFVVGIDIERADLSHIYLAVSTSSRPEDGSDWHKYQLDFTHHPEGTGLGIGPHFPDYEKLGVNDDALFVSANYFPIRTGSGSYAGIAAFDKQSLLNGNAPRLLYEEYFPGFSVFPLNQFDSGSIQYFAEAVEGVDDTIRIHAVTDVLTDPQRHVHDLTVPSYIEPVDVPQLGGGTPIESVGKRIMTGLWRDGSAWFAHGVIDPALGDNEDVVRWYEVATNGFPEAPPEVIQLGNVDPGPGLHAWMPGIAVDGEGNMSVGFSYGGPSIYAGAAYTGRLASDPLGQTDPVYVYAEGLANYERVDGSGRNRWGDYTGMVVDPSDDATFWVYSLYAANLNRWATELASFRLSPTADVDMAQFRAVAGDAIAIETTTPLDAAGALQNTLDPSLRLLNSDGNVLAIGTDLADGRNERIEFTVPETGVYYVEVMSESSEGTYLVSIQGANGADPGPQPISSLPSDEQLLNEFPRTFQLNMSESILASTADARDLRVNGIAATSVSLEGNSLTYLLNPLSNQGTGQYTVEIDAGSMGDLQGNLLAETITQTFTVDVSGPRVTGTRWNDADFPADRRFDPGPLVFEAQFDEDVFLLASARRGPLTPGADDVILTDTSRGTVIEESSIRHDNTIDQFRAEYDHLPEGNYELRLASRDGAFQDNAGNLLDGEPIGANLDGTVTGDDVPGGDYVVSFIVDNQQEQLNVFQPVATLGSLVSRSRDNDGFLNDSSDVDLFSFTGQADQTIAVQLVQENPQASITVQLVSDSGDTLIEASGDAGQPVVIPAQPISQTGRYRLRVAADQPTHYTLDAWINAEIEASFADTSPTDPLSLDVAEVDLVGGRRWAAVGSSERQMDFAVSNDPTKFVDISSTGEALNLTDDGEVALESTIGNELIPAGRITVGNNGAILVGATINLYFQNLPLPAPDLGRGLFVYWDDLGTPIDDVYFEVVEIDGVEALVVQWNQLPHFPSVGEITFQVQIFDSGPILARFAYPDVEFGQENLDNGATATIGYQESAEVAFEYLFGGADLVTPLEPTGEVHNNDVIDLSWAADVDDYTLDLSSYAGNPIDIALSGLDGADFSGETVQVLDADGNVLATSTSQPLGNDPLNFDLGILGFRVPETSSGLFTIRVTSATFSEYSLLVTESAVLDTEPNEQPTDVIRSLADPDGINRGLGHLMAAGDVDAYSLPVAAGSPARISAISLFPEVESSVTNGLDLRLQVLSADGSTVLASDDNGFDGLNPLINWIPDVSEVVTIVVSSQAGSGDYLLLTDSDFDPPEFAISSVSEEEGDSGITQFVFDITRSHNASEIRFDVSTFADTATEGVDFLPVNQSVELAAGGALTYQLTVGVVGDLDVESDEQFGVQLERIVGTQTSSLSTMATIVNDDDFGPRVLAVALQSTSWTDAFAQGLGAGPLGHVISDGNQLDSIPWTKIDRIAVSFDQDVSGSVQHPAALVLRRTSPKGDVTDVTREIVERRYETASNTLTLELSRSLAAGNFTLILFDSIESSGNALDGEWVTGQSGPSGDQRVGGDFVFRFAVFPADVDGDRSVTPRDLSLVRAAIPSETGSSEYLVDADIDGSGIINDEDREAVLQRVLEARFPGLEQPELNRAVAVDRWNTPIDDTKVIDKIFEQLRPRSVGTADLGEKNGLAGFLI